MTKAAKWRNWTSIALLVASAIMVWPTIRWYTLSPSERDRAEASVQPETENPHLRSVLDTLQREGDEELIESYRELYQLKEGTIKLGLDLQGGMYLSYTVIPTPGLDEDEAIDQALEVIRNRINEFGVSEPSITRQGSDRIVVQLPGVRDPERARDIVERQALLEFKLVAYPTEEHPTVASVPVLRTVDNLITDEEPQEPEPLDIGTDDSVQVSSDTAASAELTLPDPEDATEGLSMPDPQGASTEGFTLTEPSEDQQAEEEIALPDMGRPGSLSSLIEIASEELARSTTGIAPGDWVVYTGDNMDRLNDILNRPDVDSVMAEANLSFVFGRMEETPDGSLRPLYLLPRDMTRGWERQAQQARENYLLTGANLTDVRIRMGGGQSLSNNPYLILEFDSEGAENWERITGENVDQRVAIVLDGTVYSAATITERISGAGTRLSGGFSTEEARDLRLVLKAGSLPAELEIAEEQTIGPSLGQQSIDRGMLAGIIAIALVAAFIIIYYSTGGVIAILALIFDMLIIMGVLCFPGPLARIGMQGLNATLTLPGIAGIILTIGMAVDASVLIYERIREEKKAGKGIRTAVKAGYSRAFVTILDANLTTLITALVLYKFGTGPIRGFAVTLSIGILASMFCSLVFSRAVIQLLLRSGKKKDLSFGKWSILGDKHFSFVKNRKKTYVISLAVILVGAAAFFINGGLDLSIDFTGGLETNVISSSDITSGELKDELTTSGLEDVQVQELMDYEGDGAAAFVVRTSETDKDLVYQSLEANGCVPMERESESEGLSFIKQIGPRVGEELKSKAINAIFMAMIFIIFYVWYRFQFKWGVAAVAALAHDTIITVGILALIRLDISLTIIAAILTIVGYSINDTIVVFDRIREDRRLRKGKTLAETVNISINEVLSRTVITSLTTFMAATILFIISGGVLSRFALTLMIGIVVGTYSSIFVASPILVDWHAKLKKRK
ncbi:MAG: protein translocase subunit SecD [Candidatus Aegiribacteria sp.]|nr:protein translocase subunit SecD [Candidatus Aegiribacteria sp.]MBD3295160.1 protein translocase subunit SecD [Candidatus Fermentibacteria bacterium]